MKNIFHEVHLTVEHKQSFEDDCESLKVKPIIIDMGSEIPTHSMTSSVYENKSDSEVYMLSLNLKNKLEDLGYTIQRLKIETVPWHPQGVSPKEDQYFEAHFAIKGEIPLETLEKFKLHKSRNLLKKSTGSVQMLTYRVYEVNTFIFNELIDSIEAGLKLIPDLDLIKTIREFAIYDSNSSLDDQWLKG